MAFSEKLLAGGRREHAAVLAAIAGVVLLAWLYLLRMAMMMDGMQMDGTDMGRMGTGQLDMTPMGSAMGPAMGMAGMQAWGAADLLMLILMWVVMMIGMMLPTALPMILMFVTINRKRRAKGETAVPTALFVSGYVLVWSAFSVAAALVQWGLHEAALLSPMMVSTNAWLGGGLFLAAGIYQWSSLKYVCLRHCQTPLGFIMSSWREGRGGALRMGLHHGAYCTGCCWVLMALLFVGGVMNLLWVAAIAGFVLAEKVIPGRWFSRATGTAMLAWGFFLMAAPFLG
jgi:predicted metal-binding membrane protein